ncbi:MAG: hypothetical protein ACNYPH_03435 [Gammaproteobacteria bacterium WSBS_2016_MAG_OTU1]
MIFFAKTIARIINARQSSAQRLKMSRHAGKVIAVCTGKIRLCWRIGKDGRWLAAAGFLSADAEIAWAIGESPQIGGNSALLQDAEEVWKHNAPHKILAEIIGAESAETITTTCKSAAACAKNSPFVRDVLADADSIENFKQQTTALDTRARDIANRLLQLEKNYARN